MCARCSRHKKKSITSLYFLLSGGCAGWHAGAGTFSARGIFLLSHHATEDLPARSAGGIVVGDFPPRSGGRMFVLVWTMVFRIPIRKVGAFPALSCAFRRPVHFPRKPSFLLLAEKHVLFSVLGAAWKGVGDRIPHPLGPRWVRQRCGGSRTQQPRGDTVLLPPPWIQQRPALFAERAPVGRARAFRRARPWLRARL